MNYGKANKLTEKQGKEMEAFLNWLVMAVARMLDYLYTVAIRIVTCATFLEVGYITGFYVVAMWDEYFGEPMGHFLCQMGKAEAFIPYLFWGVLSLTYLLLVFGLVPLLAASGVRWILCKAQKWE